MDLPRTHSSHTEDLEKIWEEPAQVKTSGLDKAALQVALVESSNLLQETPSMVLAGEGLEGPAMALRLNSPNNIKVRPRIPNSVTLKRVPKVVLSTLTNVLVSIGNK